MWKKALKIIEIICIVILCLFIIAPIIFITYVSLTHNISELEDFFAEWEPENTSYVAIVSGDYDIIIVDGKTYDLEEMLGKHYIDVDPSSQSVFMEEDGRIYGIQKYNFLDKEYGETIDIYRLDLATGELEVLYSDKYCPLANEGTKLYAEHYYEDRNIVIYDGTRTTVFNIDTLSAEDLPPEAFSVPTEKFEIITGFKHEDGPDFKRCIIKSDKGERELTIEYMAQRHEYIKRVAQLEPNPTIFGTVDRTERFFNNAFIINGVIYLKCVVLEKDGERNTVIFSYDYENETFEFIGHYFSSDYANIYLIPRE